MKAVYVLLLATLFLACRKDQSSGSTPPKKTILIIGNSITEHPVNASLGWFNNWGMAATSRENDFVHVFTKKVQAENPLSTVYHLNISGYEDNFAAYNLKQLDTLVAKKPDIIIFRLGENVPQDNRKAFINNYNTLISYLTTSKEVKIIVTDCFWDMLINDDLKTFAEVNNFNFVSIKDLSVAENMSYGRFENPAVEAHPNDRGMRIIAERLFAAVEEDLK